MPHVRVILRAYEAQIRALLTPADIRALALVEAPIWVLLRILPRLEPPPEQAATQASSSSAGHS
eukprot:9540556-Karenia_brevis.AAC.1